MLNCCIIKYVAWNIIETLQYKLGSETNDEKKVSNVHYSCIKQIRKHIKLSRVLNIENPGFTLFQYQLKTNYQIFYVSAKST